LPSRQTSREGPVKKHEIPDEMSWQKAEENLQKLIQVHWRNKFIKKFIYTIFLLNIKFGIIW
jgi:hypothetical protein